MFRFAIANLRSRPGRTALSVLGLTIAIAGMVGLFSIAGGIASVMESSFGDIDGIVVLQNGAPIPIFSTLPAAWGDEIAELDGIHVVTPELWARANLINDKPIITPPRMLLGTDLPSWLKRRHGVFSDAIEEGRFLDDRDIGTNRTVISRSIADEFETVIGDAITVNGRELKVIGIYEVGSVLLDVTIVVDIALLREMTRAAPDAVSSFYVEPREDIENDLIISRIETLFENRELPAWQPSNALSGAGTSGIGALVMSTIDSIASGAVKSPDDSSSDEREASESEAAVTPKPALTDAEGAPANDGSHEGSYQGPISVQSVVEWSTKFQELTADLDLILGLITALGIAIAVSSIFNTMLMSVTERTVEFGILRANGWSQRDVTKLITCEAALLGIAGGLLGVTLGWTATLIINAIWSDRVHLYAGPLLIILGLVFAVLVGMLGGFYPALRAARLSPMDAIRRG